MIIISYKFIIFLILTSFVYHLIPHHLKAWFLLIAGYLFYSYTGWQNIIILLGVTFSAFVFGIIIQNNRNLLLLSFGIIATISPLLITKFNQFTESFSSRDLTSFVIPIGLSFYSLQALGYLLDVYWQRILPERRVSSIALYLAFFPIMLSGPIERAKRLIPQLNSIVRLTPAEIYIAAKQLLWGFFCKLILADKLAIISHDIFNNSSEQSGSILLIGLFIYSFQIYFDFYGYSSIAIASARLFGVNVIPNFNHPYLASSLVGFWQKWHISLSSWLRDYVYLPIAYKMKPIFSFSIAILLVFIVSGAWHGMTMNYLVWGAIHGTLIVVGQLTKKRRHQIWKNTLKGRLSRVRHTLQIVWVFLLVSLAWVFFVVPQLKNAFNVLTRIIIWDHGSISNSVGNILFRPEFAAYILCVIIFFTIDSLGVVTSVVESVPESKKKIFRELLLINSFIVLIILFGDIGTQNFIYLRF